MPNHQRFEDPVLSRVAYGYRMANGIGMELFPRVEVSKMTGKVLTFDKSNFILLDTERAPGAQIKTTMSGAGKEPIALIQYSLAGKVPREWLREASDLPALNHQTRAVNGVMSQFAMQLEVTQAKIARDASNYSANNKTTLSGNNQWTDKTQSDPKSDIDNGREAVRASIGMYPNIVAFSAKAWTAFKNHPKTLEQFKYTSAKSITAEMAAGYLEVDKVVIGAAVVAESNLSDPNLIDIWGEDVVMAYVPMNETFIDIPSFGYTYELAGSPLVEEGYFDKSTNSWIYPVEANRRPYITGMDAGYLIKDAVA